MTPHRSNIRSMIATPKTMPPRGQNSGVKHGKWAKRDKGISLERTRSLERWFWGWRKDFSKRKPLCFSHVDTFFHSFNFFAFDVPVFSAQCIRSPPSPQLPYRFHKWLQQGYKACINGVAILN